MTTVSNIAIGAHLAGNAAAKARHGMNEAIARLSTGVRGMYGGDAASTGAAFQFRAEGASAYVAARNAEDGISFLQAAESVLLELAALNTRLRELEVQSTSALLQTAEIAAITAEETAIDTASDLIEAYELNGTGLLNAQVKFTTSLDGGTTAFGATTAAIALAKDSADTKMALIQKDFGNVAAGISALKGVQGALYSLAANSDATAARMMDTDFAKSSANLAKFTVLNQSAMAMVAQANQANSSILAVLQ